MSGRRPSPIPKNASRSASSANSHDRTLVTAQWMTGIRISEILSLTVGSVLRDETVVDKIGVAPRHLKGKRGTTRWVSVLPELRRALES